MKRCSPHHPLLRLAAACSAALLMTCTLPAAAQQTAIAPGTRTFPESALRGFLTVKSTVEATINDTAIRMAPGMRLFSTQNSLTFLHTVIGQKFKVNYVVEQNTGMLLTAWILTDAEAAIPRKGAQDHIERNFSADSDKITTLR